MKIRTGTRRFLSLLMALVMVLSLLPALALAEDGGSATLVTSVSSLSAGDQVIIVAKDSDYALGTTQNSNNRKAVAIKKSTDGATVTFGAEVQVLTLEAGTKDNTFAFSTGSGYLYAASSSKNYLKTETVKSDNSSWTIEISSGVTTIKAQGENTRNWMRYNPNNGTPLFACYASGQQDICIYKLSGGSDPV